MLVYIPITVRSSGCDRIEQELFRRKSREEFCWLKQGVNFLLTITLPAATLPNPSEALLRSMQV